MQVKKQHLEQDMEQQIGSKVRKECVKALYRGLVDLTFFFFFFFNFYTEYIMWNAGLDEIQAGIKISRRNINNLRCADDTTLMAESKEAKRLLMRVKEESEKAGLKLSIQKTKIMASGPITSWQTDGGTMKRVADFIFLGSKITVDGDCNH